MSDNLKLIYTSDPFVAGFQPVKKDKEYVYENEFGDVWDDDAEFDIFEGEMKDFFEGAPGWIARGSVKDWQGVSPGGKVFVNWDFRRIMGAFFANCDGYGGLSVYYDTDNGVFVFQTANHDGGMTMTMKMLTQKGVDKYLDTKDMFDRIDIEGELFDNGKYSEPFSLGGF